MLTDTLMLSKECFLSLKISLTIASKYLCRFLTNVNCNGLRRLWYTSQRFCWNKRCRSVASFPNAFWFHVRSWRSEAFGCPVPWSSGVRSGKMAKTKRRVWRFHQISSQISRSKNMGNNPIAYCNPSAGRDSWWHGHIWTDISRQILPSNICPRGATTTSHPREECCETEPIQVIRSEVTRERNKCSGRKAN